MNSGPRSDIPPLGSRWGKPGIPGPCSRPLQAVMRFISIYQRLNDVIHVRSDRQHYRGDLRHPRDTIKPESHAIDDLGIDSLDFLDIVFAIDKEFGIKIPLEQWTQEVNDGKVTTEQYFVLQNLANRIDELVAAKNARAGTARNRRP